MSKREVDFSVRVVNLCFVMCVVAPNTLLCGR